MDLLTILLIIFLIAALGGFPVWGYGPSGLLLVVVVVLVVLLLRRGPRGPQDPI